MPNKDMGQSKLKSMLPTDDDIMVTIRIEPLTDPDESLPFLWKATCLQMPDIYFVDISSDLAYEGMISLLDELTSHDRVLH